ncbi:MULTISPECIES: hypothetical protein [Nocardia]|uniref:hypothetical protein n=1 Tax=Nocardia TaxID=1817 RepID=UPI0005681C6B|nr:MULTISPECIES: hypothetical protein [Nocardia]
MPRARYLFDMRVSGHLVVGTQDIQLERTGTVVVALLMVIGSVSLIVIAVHAAVVAVWTAKLRVRRTAAALRGAAPLVAKTVVHQPLLRPRAGADATS